MKIIYIISIIIAHITSDSIYGQNGGHYIGPINLGTGEITVIPSGHMLGHIQTGGLQLFNNTITSANGIIVTTGVTYLSKFIEPPCVESSTSSSHTILVDTTVLQQLSEGDYILAFADTTIFGCFYYNGNSSTAQAFSCWGKDNFPPASPNGFNPSQQIKIKIYKKNGQVIKEPSVDWAPLGHMLVIADQDAYRNNGISMILNISDVITYPVVLPVGWVPLSLPIAPESNDLDSIFGGISNYIDLIKDPITGGVKLFNIPIDLIGNWDVTSRFMWLKLNTQCTLTVKGLELASNLPIGVMNGWNPIPYTRTTDTSVTIGLSDLENQGVLDIAKNSFGNIYSPLLGINTMGSLVTNYGNWVHCNQNTFFTYPDNSIHLKSNLSIPKMKAAFSLNSPTHFDISHLNISPSMATVLIPTSAIPFIQLGDEFGIFEDTLLIGAVYIDSNSNVAINIFGDDSFTPNIDGAIGSSLYLLKYWNSNEQQEYILPINFNSNYDSTFVPMGLSYVNWVEAPLLALDKKHKSIKDIRVYPNPTKSKLSIEHYGLKAISISLFTNLGQLVLTEKSESDDILIIPVGHLERGVYILQIESDGKQEVVKVILD